MASFKIFHLYLIYLWINRGGIQFCDSKTLTHMVVSVVMGGGVQFSDSKTLTTMVGKCGGGWSRELKTLTHDNVWYGTVAPPPGPRIMDHN